MTPQELIKVINNAFVIDITSNSRKREVVYARFVYCYKLRHTKDYYYSYQNIAKHVKRHHATVIHAIKQYELLKDYEDFKHISDKIEKEIERFGGYKTNKISRLLTNHFEVNRYNIKMSRRNESISKSTL